VRGSPDQKVATEIAVNEHGPCPTVSVVVSTRNHARYLGETLAAFAAQIWPRVELILVDNASTDETEAVARSFAAGTGLRFTYVRLASDCGPAVGRNCGIERAAGSFVAFTDSDCVPSSRWLSEGVAAFDRPSLGIVQGRTECYQARARLFSHFIETRRFDSSFSTSNVIYRRSALGSHRFDPSCAYWEDTDLGFQVAADGWETTFAPGAVVYHQAVPQSASGWLLWPARYANWPAKAARYPDFRRSLFLGVWVRPLHACFDVAVLGLAAAALGRRRWGAVLLTPYLVSLACARGIRGRAPLMKMALYAARDTVACAALVSGSIRHRTVVL
jgi:glycosyltransferase involved in cell wall biosynthesis